jgi:hypothetical protein
MMKASLLRLWLAFKRLTQLAFPRRFPIVQFPNLPLIVALLTGVASTFLHGNAHSYTAAVSYLAMTVWAYEELAHGVNWFRRLLGLTYVIILILLFARALRPGTPEAVPKCKVAGWCELGYTAPLGSRPCGWNGTPTIWSGRGRWLVMTSS